MRMKQIKISQKCSIEECDRPLFCKNLCVGHYTKLRRYGDPEIGGHRIIKEKTCSIFNCNAPHYGKGLCKKHYRRFLTHGDPLKIKKRKITRNKIKYIDEETIQMELPGGFYCLLDADKYDIIKDLRWCVQSRKNNSALYVIANKTINGKTQYFRMSRLIMNCPVDKEVDHIGGSKTALDNRVRNLRIVNRSQNGRNRPLISKSSTGYKNIYVDKGTYRVQVRLNGKLHCRGKIYSINEALKIRKEMLEKLHGEYTRREDCYEGDKLCGCF